MWIVHICIDNTAVYSNMDTKTSTKHNNEMRHSTYFEIEGLQSTLGRLISRYGGTL